MYQFLNLNFENKFQTTEFDKLAQERRERTIQQDVFINNNKFPFYQQLQKDLDYRFKNERPMIKQLPNMCTDFEGITISSDRNNFEGLIEKFKDEYRVKKDYNAVIKTCKITCEIILNMKFDNQNNDTFFFQKLRLSDYLQKLYWARRKEIIQETQYQNQMEILKLLDIEEKRYVKTNIYFKGEICPHNNQVRFKPSKKQNRNKNSQSDAVVAIRNLFEFLTTDAENEVMKYQPFLSQISELLIK